MGKAASQISERWFITVGFLRNDKSTIQGESTLTAKQACALSRQPICHSAGIRLDPFNRFARKRHGQSCLTDFRTLVNHSRIPAE